MIGKTEVILIAPDYLMGLAQESAESLSSRKGIRARSFEVKAFLKKPRSARPGRFFISLGETSENSFTKEAMPRMTHAVPAEAPYVALDSCTALLFGGDVSSTMEVMKALPGESVKAIKGVTNRTVGALKHLGKAFHIGKSEKDSKNSATDEKGAENTARTVAMGIAGGSTAACVASVGVAAAPAGAAGALVVGSVGVAVEATINAYNRPNEIRIERMSVVLKEFLEEHFDTWITEGMKG